MPAHCHFNTMLLRFLCVAFGAWRDLRFSRRTCRDEFDGAWPSGSGHDFFCFSRFFPVDRGNHSIRLEGALNSCEKGRIVLLGVERKIIADGGGSREAASVRNAPVIVSTRKHWRQGRCAAVVDIAFHPLDVFLSALWHGRAGAGDVEDEVAAATQQFDAIG